MPCSRRLMSQARCRPRSTTSGTASTSTTPPSSLPCLDAGNTRTYPALSPSGQEITVTCAPDPTIRRCRWAGAGQQLQQARASPSSPWAREGSSGLDKPGNRPLKIKGSVYVNSTIRADATGTPCSADLAAAGQQHQLQRHLRLGHDTQPGQRQPDRPDCGCTGTVMTKVPGNKHCPSGHSVGRRRPGGSPSPAAYAQPTAGMIPRALPTCASNPVTFDARLLRRRGRPVAAHGRRRVLRRQDVLVPSRASTTSTSTTRRCRPQARRSCRTGPNVWTFNDANGVLVAGHQAGLDHVDDQGQHAGVLRQPAHVGAVATASSSCSAATAS